MASWGEQLHVHKNSKISTQGDANHFYSPHNTSKFVTNKVFPSREALIEWVQQVGRSIGYVIVIKRSKRESSGVISKVCFMCDRGGVYRGTKISSRNTSSRKINCPFDLRGKYEKRHNWWTLRVVCDKHNHGNSPHMKGHPYAMRLSENEVQLVDDLSTKYVKPVEILSVLKEKNVDNVATLRTIYNARRKSRIAKEARKTEMQVVMSFLQEQGYVHEGREDEANNELEALFFAHPKSLERWRGFPNVMLIDATYKINWYKMSLVEIVGVTSSNITFCIAFVYLHKENESNYTWALNRLKSTMEDCIWPRVIITDRDLAIMNACNIVFPDAKRFLCRWHIYQNILENCKPSILDPRTWSSFNQVWKKLVESPTKEWYCYNLAGLEAILFYDPGVFDYLNKEWLTPYKEMFVSAWTDEYSDLGSHTSNRVEMQTSKLKSYLELAKPDLKSSIFCIHEVIQSQHQ